MHPSHLFRSPFLGVFLVLASPRKMMHVLGSTLNAHLYKAQVGGISARSPKNFSQMISPSCPQRGEILLSRSKFKHIAGPSITYGSAFMQSEKSPVKGLLDLDLLQMTGCPVKGVWSFCLCTRSGMPYPGRFQRT